MRRLSPVFVSLLFLLIGCSSNAAETPFPTELPATSTPVEAAEPTATVEKSATTQPTNTPTAEPTATPTEIPATETPEPDQDVAIFEDPTLGFKLDYPAEWEAQSFMGIFMLIASELDDIESGSAPEGAILAGFAGPNEGRLIDEMAESTALDSGFAEEGAEVVSGPDETTVDGKRAIYIEFEAENNSIDQFGTVTVVDNGDYFAMFVTIVQKQEKAELQPLLDAMIASVEIGEPDLDSIASELFEPEFVNAMAGDATVLQPGEVALAIDEVAVAYTVTLSAETPTLFISSEAAGLDTKIEIFSPVGEPLISQDVNYGDRPETLQWQAPEAGEYLVTVSTLDFLPGEHHFAYQPLGKWTDDEISSKQPEVTIEIAPNQLPQMLIVAGDDPLDLVVDVVSPARAAELAIDNGVSGDGEYVLIPPFEEVVSLVVSDFDKNVGAVRYQLVELDPQFIPPPAAITVLLDAETLASSKGGFANSERFDVDDETDTTFTLIGVAGHKVALYVSTEDDGFDAVINVFDGEGNYANGIDDTFDGEAEALAFEIEAMTAMAFEIEIENFNDAAGDFSVEIFFDNGVIVRQQP